MSCTKYMTGSGMSKHYLFLSLSLFRPYGLSHISYSLLVCVLKGQDVPKRHPQERERLENVHGIDDLVFHCELQCRENHQTKRK